MGVIVNGIKNQKGCGTGSADQRGSIGLKQFMNKGKNSYVQF